MAQIDTVRPASTVNAGSPAWAAVGAASLHAATSDNNDATYAQGAAGDGIMALAHTSHTPPAGHQRHLLRGRVRMERDNPGAGGVMILNFEVVRGTQPTGTGISAENPEDTMTTESGPWSAAAALGLQLAGAQTFRTRCGIHPANDTAINVAELYIDIDCRAKPSFTGDVQDAAGVSQDGGTITDTNRPRIVFDSTNYDGLPARQFEIIVTDDATGAVVETQLISGAAETVIIGPLPNGNYTITQQIWSTIRLTAAYASDITTLTVEVDFTAPAPPVITSVVDAGCGGDVPHLEVCWEEATPTANVFDSEPYVELIRQDCSGDTRILTRQAYEGCWCDRFTPFDKAGEDSGCGPGPALALGEIVTGGTGVSTPDIAFAGDIQITAKIVPVYIGEQPITFQLRGDTIAAQWGNAGNRSWWFHVREGTLIFVWSTDGTNFDAVFQVLEADPAEILYVRVAQDVNNGGGSRDTSFYTSADGLNWTQLGETQTFGTAGALFNSTSVISIGYIADNNDFQFLGGIYDVEIRNGIEPAGSVVANPDFTEWPVGDTTYVDDAGKTWTIVGGAYIGAPPCTPTYKARYWGLVDDSLVATDWAGAYAVTPTNGAGDDLWLKGQASGDLALCVVDRGYGRVRPFGAFTDISGGIPTVITALPGGRNYSLTFSLETEADLVALETILAQPVVLFQPIDQRDVWLAVNSETVELLKIAGRRRLSATFVEVEPQPAAVPASLFDED